MIWVQSSLTGTPVRMLSIRCYSFLHLSQSHRELNHDDDDEWNE